MQISELGFNLRKKRRTNKSMTLQPVQPDTQAQAWSARSDGITLTALYYFFVASLFLIGSLIMTVPALIFGVVALAEEPDALFGFIAVGLIGGVLLVLGLLNLVVGYGLWKVYSWGRTGAIVLAMIGLIFVPIGTIPGAIVLWYLLQPEVAARFRS